MLKAAAESIFGITCLKEEQVKAIETLQSGKDCLVVLPTGFGKSICYALPACLNREGLVLVISPLIALIREQVKKLHSVNVSAYHFDSQQDEFERAEIWRLIENNECRILFISPERLASPEFRSRLQACSKIHFVAVDEAHCVSVWGDGFRPDYTNIPRYLKSFGDVQKLALTATAPQDIRDEICKHLALREPVIISASPIRANLRTKIHRFTDLASQRTAVLQFVLSQKGNGIVYCSTRKSADEVHRMLEDAGVSPILLYHAGLSAEARSIAQNKFIHAERMVMIATNAFGMGIDKKDIRFVVHVGLPRSSESYLQEIGRAGRDSLPAECRAFFTGRDVKIQEYLIDKGFISKESIKKLTAFLRYELEAGGTWMDESKFWHLVEKSLDTPSQDLAQQTIRCLFAASIIQRDPQYTDTGKLQRGWRINVASLKEDDLIRNFEDKKILLKQKFNRFVRSLRTSV